MRTRKTWDKLLAELEEKEKLARIAGGVDKQRAEKEKNKLLCRERIEALVDPGSFVEVNMLAETQTFEFDMQKKKILGDGVVTGFATLDGRRVFVYSQDVTVFRGSAGKAHGEKINHILRMARKVGAPVIGLYESAGGRLQDGIQNESGYGQMFFENTQCSGVVPQIAAVMGVCTGGAAYSPALMDFIIQVEKTGQMFITSPRVIEEVTGEKIPFEELGGTRVHAEESGVVHLVAKDDWHCIELIKKLISYLPQNNQETPALVPTDDDPFRPTDVLTDIVPADPKEPFDVKKVIREITDNCEFLEIQPSFAKNIVVGFGRIDGRSVGVVANQPRFLEGYLDIDAADKAARFIRFCDCFNIPLIVLEDAPGFLPEVSQERKGIIRHGAKMLYAFSEATVPKITCVLRKSYDGAIPAMCCHETGADIMFAWPTAEFAMVEAEVAVSILYRREIAESEDPVRTRLEKIREYEDSILSPYYAASKQYVDAVIHPRDTRAWFAHSLRLLENKTTGRITRKKHGNIPL